MSINKPLHIPPSKGQTGLKVFCKECETDVYEVCKQTNKPIATCKFAEEHVFKVYAHIPGTKWGRKTKTLKTRILNEAKVEASEFINEVQESPTKGPIISDLKIVEPSVNNLNRPYLLKDAIFKYIAFLYNEGVPKQNVKHRGEKHLGDLKNELMFFLKTLTDAGYDLSKLGVSTFSNQDIISTVYEALESNFSLRTFNKRLTNYKAMEVWLHKELNYPLSESWKKIMPKEQIYEPKSISKDEYYHLLKVIIPENGFGKYHVSGKVLYKNYYKPWVVVAIKLALETGCRREELVRMKFSDIIEENGEKPYLRVVNLKVTRRKGITDTTKGIPMPIPISHGLITLLKELGINKYKGTDEYLLAPEITVLSKRKGIMDYLTRSFTHFYNLINRNGELKFKNLRKTNLTYKKVFSGLNTTHSSDAVIEKHYEDKIPIARGLFGYKLFPEESEPKDKVNYWA